MINDYIWEVSESATVEYSCLKLHPVVLSLLEKRDLREPEEIHRFLYSDLNHLYNPFLMKDMDKAVARVNRAIDLGERITVYGDYDVDGITSSCILVKLIKILGGNVDYYIPSRVEEGYGLNREALEKIHSKGTTLIITVDNGIGAFEEVKLAKDLGIDMIITDHHEPGSSVPEALAVINPKQEDCPYPFKNLAGVGVALKLAHALRDLDEEVLEDYLDLAALGTVADIVPLLDENRIITKIGLKRLQNTNNKGLRAIALKLNLSMKDIDTDKISFMLAPRLNAVGRIADPSLACELLLTEDEGLATELAEQLEMINRERQSIEAKIFTEAKGIIEEDRSLDDYQAIVLTAPHWHPGVLGIVASKLANAYHRPCVLLVQEGEIARGSGRSVPGFNMFEALSRLSQHLIRFGGHDQAAGITIKTDNISAFTKALNELTCDVLREEDRIPKLEIDLELRAQEIDMGLAEQIELMEPFGFGNPKPLFMCKNLSPCKLYTVGNGKRHLKLSFKSQLKPISAIGFNFGDHKDEVDLAPSLDVAFYLEVNRWQGYVEPQMNIKGLKAPYLKDETLQAMEDEYYQRFFANFDNAPSMSSGTDLEFFSQAPIIHENLEKQKCLDTLFKSGSNVIVMANTPYKAWRLIDYLKKIDPLWDNVYFDVCAGNRSLSNNTILINPEEIPLELADHVVFYDMPFSIELFNQRLNRVSPYCKIHLLCNEEDIRYNYLVCKKALPNAEGIRTAYRLLRSVTSGNFTGKIDIKGFNKLLSKYLNEELHDVGLINVFKVFCEIGIIDYKVIGDTIDIYKYRGQITKADLEDSLTYRSIKRMKVNIKRLEDRFAAIRQSITNS